MSIFRHHRGTPQPPPVTPPTLNLSTFGAADPSTVQASIQPDSWPVIVGDPDPVHLGRFSFHPPLGTTGGASLMVTAPGYVPINQRLQMGGVDVPLPLTGSIELDPVALRLLRPPVPSRDQACQVKMHFQGLDIQTDAFGLLPWFSASLPSMEAVGELDSVIAQLQTAGDTHIPIDLVWDYGSPGQPYGTGQLVPPRDLRNDLPTYCRIVDTVIQSGAKPIMVMLGEGQAGYDWLMANFERVIAALRDGYDRTAYGPVAIWYDGVWPAAWSVEMMETLLPFARRVLGDSSYLMFMFAGGDAENQYLVIKGLEDYAPGGLIYENLDIMHCTGYQSETQGEALGQIASRMLGPAFINDVDGYSGENADGHVFYPSHGCRRGTFYWSWIEWRCYEWVRRWITASAIDEDRHRMSRAGVRVAG